MSLCQERKKIVQIFIICYSNIRIDNIMTIFAWYKSFAICIYDHIVVHRLVVYKQHGIRLRHLIKMLLFYENLRNKLRSMYAWDIGVVVYKDVTMYRILSIK